MILLNIMNPETSFRSVNDKIKSVVDVNISTGTMVHPACTYAVIEMTEIA